MYYASVLRPCNANKKSEKKIQKVNSYLGRVTGDIIRQADLNKDNELGYLISQSERFLKQEKNTPKKLLKSRLAIEPIIDHMKNDHRLGRNYLLGKLGDKINAVLSGYAFNLKKIINYLKIEQSCFA